MPDTNERPIQLLLVEDNPGDALLLREALYAVAPPGFAVTHVATLQEALAQVQKGSMDVVLLDLSLPDSQQLEPLRRVHDAAPRLPVVVLTGLDDEAMGVESLRVGAQDYLVKGQTPSRVLGRAIHHALERKRLLLERDALVEDLATARNQLEERVKQRTSELTRANMQLKREIRDRIQAEEMANDERQRFFSVLNMLPGYVALLNRDLTVRFANRRYMDLFGSPNGRCCHAVQKGRAKPCEECAVLRSFESGQSGEWEWTSRTGQCYHVWAYPFPDEEGKPAILKLGVDVTQRKELERQVIATSEAVRRSIGRDLHDLLG